MIQIPRGLSASLHCAQCPCARGGKPYRPVRGYGLYEGLCIVGEAPGANEIMQGYPFVGESGKVVSKALIAAKVDRTRVFITNALLCKRPSDEDFPRAVECCRSRLQADLEAARPSAICALGGIAMRALELPVIQVAEARGTVQESPLLPGVPAIGSIHPAALLRGGAGEITKGGKQKMNVDAQAMFLFADIAKTARVAEGKVPAQWSDDIKVVHEATDVAGEMEAILHDVYAWGILGFDLEWICEGSTNPLDALGAEAYRAAITWVGVGCGTRAVSFKWAALRVDCASRTFKGIRETSGLAQLEAAMEDERLPKLCHNKQADKAIWEAQVGPIRGRHLCSLLMHHAAFPGIDHNLQQVASQFLCIPPWKVEHARAVAAAKAQEREAIKAAKLVEKEQAKAERVAAHEARNAALAAEKVERKARRQAEHEARNRQRAAEKEARKRTKREQLTLRGVG